MIYLYPLFFLFAFLYSIVGLGGGSAYTALLGISGIDYRFIPSTSLFLNVIVTLIGFLNYRVHIDFKKRKIFLILLYAFAIFGVTLGSQVDLCKKLFFTVLGITLLISSLISIFRDVLLKDKERELEMKSYILVLIFGFLFGFLGGLVGIGGGIFLSPILLIAGFPVKEIAGITSLYIFLNSSFGFISHFLRGNINPNIILPLSLFVLTGSLLGSFLGSFKFKPILIKRILTLIILAIRPFFIA